LWNTFICGLCCCSAIVLDADVSAVRCSICRLLWVLLLFDVPAVGRGADDAYTSYHIAISPSGHHFLIPW
jgi:hypothetical protein